MFGHRLHDSKNPLNRRVMSADSGRIDIPSAVSVSDLCVCRRGGQSCREKTIKIMAVKIDLF